MNENGKLPARYSKLLRRRFGFWPTWLPDSDVRVGDFGRVRHGVFERLGNAETLAVEVAATGRRSFGDHLFASHGVRQAMLGGGVGDDAILGRARIEFTRGFGVFVGLRDCGENRLDDAFAIAAKLSHLREAGHWKDDHCIVTGVVNAHAALIAIGSSGGAALELSAAAPAPDIVAWLGGEIRITAETSLAYRALIDSGCSPLFRLGRLAQDDEIVLRGERAPGPRLIEIDPRADLAGT